MPETAARTLLQGLAAQEVVEPRRLDEVPWLASGGPYRALDYAFSWRTTEHRLAAAMAECFDPLPRHDPAAGPVVQYSASIGGGFEGSGLVFADGVRLERTRRLEHVFRTVTWHVNQEAARVTSRRAVVLHAAAVVRDGRVVVLSAPMESGKSTLCTALVRAGWDYLTDEALGVDRHTLEALSYPRALSLDKGSWALFPELAPTGGLGNREIALTQWHVPVDRIRPGATRSTGRIAAIVLPHYRPGATSELREVGPGEAVVELGQQTFHFRDHPQDNLEVLGRLAGSAPTLRLDHDGLDASIQAIESLL